MQMHSYRAPWGTSLKIMSLIGAIILIGIPASSVILTQSGKTPQLVLSIIPLTILVGTLLFTIRGYELTNKILYVRRLLWRNKIELDNLKSVEMQPNAMSGSIRTFGNGGLFSFSGMFKNSTLGPYRAFVTDPKNSIVLRFPNRIIVVTPDQQQEFVAVVKSMMTT